MTGVKKLAFINLSLDTAGHRAAYHRLGRRTEVPAVDTRNGNILPKIAAPASLAVLFNLTRNEAYVTHRQAGQVSVIDAKTYNVVKTFDTLTYPE